MNIPTSSQISAPSKVPIVTSKALIALLIVLYAFTLCNVLDSFRVFLYVAVTALSRR